MIKYDNGQQTNKFIVAIGNDKAFNREDLNDLTLFFIQVTNKNIMILYNIHQRRLEYFKIYYIVLILKIAKK